MISESEFYTYISVFIKKKRSELKYTNEELSYLSNVDVAKISLLQNNKQGCSAYTLYKILLSLGINIFQNETIPKINKTINEEMIKNLEEIVSFLKRNKS